MSTSSKALILFSGGQDSTACLAYALDKFDHVETLGFDYGQTHKIELDCRAALRAEMAKLNGWGDRLGDDHTLSLPALAEIGGTALIGDGEIKMMANNLPSTFVPGRNLLFLTYGAALVELTIEHSHTCYRGDRATRHVWGYGCNDCPACELRAAGYEKWQANKGAA